MRNFVLLIFMSALSSFSQKNIDKSTIKSHTYAVMESFLDYFKIDTFNGMVNTYIYCDEYAEVYKPNDSMISTFIDRIKKIDTIKYYLVDSDYQFFRYQIKHPCITKWREFKFKNAKSIEGAFLHPTASLPIFSLNLCNAVIYGSYFGMSRCYLFHFNKISSKWEFVDELWQVGS